MPQGELLEPVRAFAHTQPPQVCERCWYDGSATDEILQNWNYSRTIYQIYNSTLQWHYNDMFRAKLLHKTLESWWNGHNFAYDIFKYFFLKMKSFYFDSNFIKHIPQGPIDKHLDSWWRHQMETFSALLAICAGNSPASGEFPAQRPVTRSFNVFFDLRLNKRLSKQSWGWWFETLSCPLWRHSNVR